MIKEGIALQFETAENIKKRTCVSQFKTISRPKITMQHFVSQYVYLIWLSSTFTPVDAKSAAILPSCNLIGYIVTREITAQMPLDTTFANSPTSEGDLDAPGPKFQSRNGGRVVIHDRVPAYVKVNRVNK